jgi:hypothetical protein
LRRRFCSSAYQPKSRGTEKVTNEVTIRNETRLAGLAAFAQDNDTVMLAGDPLYFKKGFWFRGEKEFDPSGHHFLVNHLEAYTGWTRWGDKKPVDQRLVRCADYARKEPREALGFTDKNQWETNDRGIPQDPWQPSDRIVLRTMDSGEDLLTFITGSVGGRNAIAKLLGKVARSVHAAEGQSWSCNAAPTFMMIMVRSIIRSFRSSTGPIGIGTKSWMAARRCRRIRSAMTRFRSNGRKSHYCGSRREVGRALRPRPLSCSCR